MHANKGVGVHIIVRGTPQVQFTLKDIQHQADFRLFHLDSIIIGPVSLKMLQFMPGEHRSDQTTVIIGQ